MRRPNFHPFEVVDRGSETQFQVAENLNKLTQQDKGLSVNQQIQDPVLINVVPISATMAQHYTNICSACSICWYRGDTYMSVEA